VKVLLDTNVILDVWLAREPFWRDSAKLLAKIERKEIHGVICPTTVTTLHYLAKKALGEEKARNLINSLLKISKIGRVSQESFIKALESEIKDFEDAVIESVAIIEAVDYIATRNLKDFRKARVDAKEPAYLI
jgi:predicted nucleic acid-binding protein